MMNKKHICYKIHTLSRKSTVYLLLQSPLQKTLINKKILIPPMIFQKSQPPPPTPKIRGNHTIMKQSENHI